MRGLGRRHAVDERDRTHLLSAALPTPTRSFRYWWAGGAWLDQGATSSCVGHAWAHWLEDGPVTQPNLVADPHSIYRRAQTVDEWAGEAYDGTSVRAGAKVLQADGLISAYQWSFDLDTTITALLEIGPVVVGTNWYASMFAPDQSGTVEISGRIVGGHAWLLNGVNTDAERVRCKNSWSRGWGLYGHFYLSFADLGRLIAEDGEVCRAVERRQSV